MTEATPSAATGRRRLKIAAFVVVLFLIVFLVVELFLRLFDPLGVWYFAEAARYLNIMQDSDDFAYIHTPGFKGRFQAVDVSINSHGFRGPDFKTEKPEGRKRLMILGDSVVFGWGAPQDSLFPVRLQQMLNKTTNTVEVISCGVGSWNTRTEYEFLKARGIKYDPDVLLLVIVDNDVEIKERGRLGIDREALLAGQKPEGGLRRAAKAVWHFGVSVSYTVRYVQFFRKVATVKRLQKKLGEDSPEWRDTSLALESIVRLCRERHIALLVYLYASDETLAKNRLLQLFTRRLDVLGVPYHTMPPELFTDRRLQNSVADPHLNARGHERIARAMLPEVLPLLK